MVFRSYTTAQLSTNLSAFQFAWKPKNKYNLVWLHNVAIRGQSSTLMNRIQNQTIPAHKPKPSSLISTSTMILSSHFGLPLPNSLCHSRFPLQLRINFSLRHFFIHLIHPLSLVPIASSSVCPPAHPYKVTAFTTRVRKPLLIQGTASQNVFLLNLKVFIMLGTPYLGVFHFDILRRHCLTVAAYYLSQLISNDP